MRENDSTARAACTVDLHQAGDAALLAAAHTGVARHAAFRELYRRYHRPVFTFLLRRLPDRPAAEEAVQESFLRLWRAADQYDERRGSVAALLFTIARNVATDSLRHQARRPVVQLAADRMDESGAAVALGDDTEVGMAVAAAMHRLPPLHREVLDLAYFGDLTQVQMAAALRVPLGTVKSRVFLALKGLRHELISVGVVA